MKRVTEGTWVWTKKAEDRAKELGLEERKEGTPAYMGYLQLGMLAPESWVIKGYVREQF